jgi:hypothetical protein
MRRFVFQSQDHTVDAEDQPAHFAPGRRLPLSRAKKSRRLFRRVVLAAIAGFGIASALALHHADKSTAPAIRSPHLAPLPAWIDIANPAELFRLEAPEFTKQTKIYTARRHRTGGGRQDILALGDLNGAGPFFRIVLYRVGEEATPPAAFFVDLARRAAETGHAITFAAQPTALPTRIGIFEAADLSLTRAGSADTSCLGFRIGDAAKLRLAGFACGGEKDAAAATFMSKATLACLLDALELTPSADEKDLVAFFAARELNDDTACDETGETRSSLAAIASDGGLRERRTKTP